VHPDESEIKLAAFNPKETTAVTLEFGEDKCRNSTEVSDWFRKNLMLDPKVILSQFFPKQGDIDGVISADKAERQRVFADKAGTAMCQTIWDMLGIELRSLPDLTGSAEKLAQARAAVAVATGALKKAEEELTGAEKLPRDSTGPSDVIARYLRAREDHKKLGVLRVEIAELKAAADKDLQVEAEVTARGKDVRVKYDAIKDQVPGAIGRLATLQALETREAQRTRLTGELAGARGKLAELTKTPPAMPPSDVEIGQMAEQIGELNSRVGNLRSWAKTFATGKCPTCGSAVADPEKILEMTREAEAGAEKVATVQRAKATLEHSRTQLRESRRQWESEISGLTSRIGHCESTLAAMPPAAEVVSREEVERIQQLMVYSKELERELQGLRESYATLSARVGRTAAVLAEKEKTLEGLLEALNSAPEEEAYKQATAALTEAQANAQAYSDLKVSHGICKGRLEDAELVLRTAEVEDAKTKPLGILKERLQRARDMFHRDALPSEVVAWYAQELVAHTESYLKMFELNFSVVVTSDLGLMAVFPDKLQPAWDLSGGEQNMLNISMRLAMADLFPSDLRLLVLDEVEVHLDAVNASKLPVLLEKVKGLARSKGLVVLFISHHPNLKEIADHVIYARE
jgi:DNA repair exonuclease SbcCD ATPase subunit